MIDKLINVQQFANNHMVINTEYGQYFQSYDSILAFKPNDGSTITVGGHWNYGATTKKHLCKWLNTTTKEIQQGIKEGSIIYDEEMK